MAESSWPSAGPATVDEAAFEQLMSGFYQSGLVGDAGDDPLIFADSTGLQFKVREERYAKVRGFTWYSGDTVVTVPVSSNASGQTRIDRAVLELDRTTWQVRMQVVEGTPGAGEPAITQAVGSTGKWQLWAGTVTVVHNASTINPSDVVPRTTFIGPPLLIASGNQLPDPNVPDVFLRYRPDQDRLILHTQGAPTAGQREIWTGQGLNQDSGEIVLASSNSNWKTTFDAAIRKIGPVVFLRVPTFERIASGTLSANSDSTLPGIIPASMRHPTRDLHIIARTTGHQAARIRINRANHTSAPGRIVLINHPGISPGEFVTGQDTTWLVP